MEITLSLSYDSYYNSSKSIELKKFIKKYWKFVKKYIKNSWKIHQHYWKNSFKLLKKSSKVLIKIIKNNWKNSSKIKKKNQNFLKNHQKSLKIHQKNLPGLAKKYFFPIELKISTNLFSIKIKKKKIFFGTWWKKIC
jgi:hypothetical protein